MPRRRQSRLLSALALCAGCGGSSPSGVGDAGLPPPDLAGPGPPDLQFATAPHPPFPQLTFHGGPVLAHPHVVTITFSSFPAASTKAVQDFADAIMGSSWLAKNAAEYGVAAGEHTKKVVLPQPPAHLTDQGIVMMLDQHIDDGMLPSPKTIKDLVFLIYLPDNVSLDDGSGSLSCTDWSGYHYDSLHGARYAYGIIADCMTGLGDIIDTASHELIEVSTNPYFNCGGDGMSGCGWYLDVDPSDPWVSRAQEEVADLCGDANGVNPTVMENGYTLERYWSNAAAAAGASPCGPVPAGEVYTNVAPKPAATQMAKPGAAVSFTITGWSTAAVPDWPIHVEVGDTVDFDPMATLSATRINNGTTATVTLHVPANAMSGQLGAAMVYSDVSNARSWPIAVEVQ